VLAVLIVVVSVLGTGCSSLSRVEQRTSQGPSARELWTLRMMVQNGRQPTHDERIDWENQLETRITQYLNQHPEAANSVQVSSFRFDRRAVVGMSKEQVLLLLDAPVSVTGSEAEMEKLARRYWPQLKGNVTEAWIYPLGWNLYFAGSRLVDITQYDEGR
jgi:hypothetical protein